MKVAELIAELQKLDQTADVFCYNDMAEEYSTINSVSSLSGDFSEEDLEYSKVSIQPPIGLSHVTLKGGCGRPLVCR
jgi:hypothetical protein